MLTSEVLKTLREQNSGRNYPLDPINSVVPFPVLIDAEIIVPYTMVSDDGQANYTIFMRSLVITTSDISIIIAAKNNANGSTVDVASAFSTYEQLKELSNSSVGLPLSPLDNTEGLAGISGSLYLGDPDTIMANGGMWDALTPETGKFDLQCIHPYRECFTGFIVNGQRLTGDIIIQAGDGIDIDVEGNTITISTGASIENQLINNRTELIEAIIDMYGQPILTINGLPPDRDGNFTFEAVDGSCVQVTGKDYGITISNPCATTCCDSSFLDDVIDNINNLNSKASRLTEYLTSVSSNLNSLANELAMLKLSASQQ